VSWIDVDWKHERPNDLSFGQMWNDVEMVPCLEPVAAVDRYLALMREFNVNGGAIFARFGLSCNRDFDWFATRRRWVEIDFLSNFLSHATVREQLPAVVDGLKTEAIQPFDWRSSLTLDGELARNLVFGGAYKKFEGPAHEAKQIGVEVCKGLFGDRFNDVEVFASCSPWSSWFMDVAWDSTHIIIDRLNQTVSIIASTDTD
jgi:hypothetical protein